MSSIYFRLLLSLNFFVHIRSIRAEGAGGGRAPTPIVFALSWNSGAHQWEPLRENGVVWITPDPFMPSLQISHNNLSATEKPITTMWQFRSRYLGHVSRIVVDNRAFPSSGFIAKPYGQPWYSRDFFSTDFFGGDASINFYDIDTITTTPGSKFLLKLRGKNPSAETIRKYVSFLDVPYYADAILTHESRHRQFIDTGSRLGEPVFGLADGWGLAQLDYSQEKPQRTASSMEVWNWKANLNTFASILRAKRTIALEYFRYIKKTYPTEWEEPPAIYRDPRTSATLSYLDASIITLYNVAPVKLKDHGIWHLSCWMFTPTKPSGERWDFVPNSNDYVYKVLQILEKLK